MKKTLNTIIASALITTIIAITSIAQSQPEPKPLLEQSFRLVISDTFEGYQYKPIHGTTVIFYLEKVTNEAGKPEWRIQQIAGPWGNSGGLVNPEMHFDKSYATEFMATFQEATRVSLWRSGLTTNFQWTERVIDVREHIGEKPQTYNK